MPSANATFKEAQSGTYTIKDFSPRAVHKMIDYLYTGDYSETSDEGGSDAMDTLPSSLSFHATMFGIGEIYCVEGLKCVSIQKYRATLTQDSNISNFLRSLLDVYCLTPDTVRDLRDTAITFAREELAVSLASKDVQQVYEEVVDAIPEFTKDLSKSFLQKPFIGTCTTCGHNKVVPIEILQCRCKKCGRGGARAFDGRAKAFQHPW